MHRLLAIFIATIASGQLINNPFRYLNGNVGLGPSAPNYPFHFEYGAPAYLPLDTAVMFGRRHGVDLAGPGSSQQAVTIQQDAHFSTGTPWALSVFQSTQTVNSNGTAAVLARVTKEVESRDISFAIHGECFNFALAGSCAAINAEAFNYGDSASTTELLGVNVQAGVSSTGSSFIAKGFNVQVHHGGYNGAGFGGALWASAGQHPYGLKIADNGGQFEKPLYIFASRPTPSVFEMVNQADGIGTAPNQIVFSRATTAPQAMIEADIMETGSFANGYIDFATSQDGALLKTARLDDQGNQIMYRGHVRLSSGAIPAARVLDPGQLGHVRVTAGATNIDVILGCNGLASGRELTLSFETKVTVEDSATANLAGNFKAGPGDTLRLICSGTYLETGRSQN